MKTIMVTGGAGFIGANFVRYLISKEPEVRIVNLDALTYSGNVANLAGIMEDERHEFVLGSITNAELVAYLLGTYEVEGIINFAAESHVDRSIEDPGIFVETNVRGTQVLLREAMNAGVKRFLQISTDEVYGALGETGLFTEETPIHPNSPYSASKAGADHLVLAASHTYGLDAVITRCSNNYGPYQFPEKMIPLMINNAREDKPLPVYGDGQYVRDWIHVEDHCEAVWEVFCKGKAGNVYNVGGNSERTNLGVIKIILQALDKPESLIRFVKDRPGHDRRYAIDASKIEKEIGWQPRHDFETGIQETIRWYIDNDAWLQDVLTGEYQEYYRSMYSERV